MQSLQGVQDSNHTVVSIPKTDMDHFKDIATSYISTISNQNQNDKEIKERQIEYREKILDHDKTVFKHKYWFLFTGLFSLLLLSAGIIFYLRMPNIGISVLSHIGAVIGGVIAGIGYESSRSK